MPRGLTDESQPLPRSTGQSSARYGACEVCRQWCSDVWINRAGDDYLFGHEACVATPSQVSTRG